MGSFFPTSISFYISQALFQVSEDSLLITLLRDRRGMGVAAPPCTCSAAPQDVFWGSHITPASSLGFISGRLGCQGLLSPLEPGLEFWMEICEVPALVPCVPSAPQGQTEPR